MGEDVISTKYSVHSSVNVTLNPFFEHADANASESGSGPDTACRNKKVAGSSGSDLAKLPVTQSCHTLQSAHSDVSLMGTD